MTVQIERAFELDASSDRVWAFIEDPGNRADAISVVERWEATEDGVTWYLSIPIPLVSGTVSVETRDVERVQNERVKFQGTSSVLRVTGEHELEPLADGGTRLVNRFLVDGRLPGVERFFKRNLDRELDNLRRALEDRA